MDTLNHSNSSLNQGVNETTDKKIWITPDVELISVESGAVSGSEGGSGAPYVPVS